MCDTFVLMPDFTARKKFYFAKNSDRDPNEAHEVVIIPQQTHNPNETLKCTYVSIPQVEKTYKMILSKPVWIWGAEMGVNEFGVVIGNEAVFSKVPPGKKPGLIGMDYLRLGLERGRSAKEALEIIISLLEIHGQSGNCGFTNEFYYHNSFIIADINNAWKLETVGKEWIVEEIKKVGSISNGYTIENGERYSKNLLSIAKEKNWWNDKQPFNFRESYSDWLFTTFSDSKQRRACSVRKINESGGSTQLTDIFSTLRSHRDEINFSPDKGLTGADLCMHAGFGPIRKSQTTGSMVVENDGEKLVVWVTGSSAPCLSLFKPMLLEQNENYFGERPSINYDSSSYWWKQERIHRTILLNYQELSKEYQKERDEMENSFVHDFSDSSNQLRTIENCFEKAKIFQDKWVELLKKKKINKNVNILYSSFWKNNNKLAEFPIK